jgi:hypothetical protein
MTNLSTESTRRMATILTNMSNILWDSRYYEEARYVRIAAQAMSAGPLSGEVVDDILYTYGVWSLLDDREIRRDLVWDEAWDEYTSRLLDMLSWDAELL